MPTVITSQEQSEIGALARQLGGYDEMLRLESEMRVIQKKGQPPKLIIDPITKRRKVVEA
jgi:hypothetical protein